jgi:hypothetical protein
MHQDLTNAFNKMIDILKADERCKGGWHFGSVGRGLTDKYSDYDPVFLVADKDFEQFAADVPKLIANISDELLICWAEDYNSSHFKNFCNAIRLGNNIHQLDFFILNHDYQEEWWCKQHLKGCTKEHIIFDRNGETSELLDKGCTTENWIPDTVRAIETYWFHVIMLIKYFKRGDIFKLIKNIHDFLFHAHVNLLLSRYDTLNWGGWESKVKHCTPIEKQENLKMYFTSADIASLETAIKKAIILFKNDADEICKYKGIDYPESISRQIIDYFNNQL